MKHETEKPNANGAAPLGAPLAGMASEQVWTALAGEIRRDGRSQAKLAREIGVSETALNQYINQKYAGSIPALEKKVLRWLDRLREGRSNPALPRAHFDLKVTDRLGALLRHAHAASDVVMAYGSYGSGKTHAARRYAARGANVWVVQPTETTTTVTTLMWLIADELKAGRAQTAAKTEDQILAFLSGRKSLLVVDDAQDLRARQLNALRHVYDRLNRDGDDFGLALLGNEGLQTKICGLGLQPLRSRIGVMMRVEESGAGDGCAMAEGLLRRPLAEAERAVVRAVVSAGAAGGLRALRKVIQFALILAGGREIAAADLKSAAGEFGFHP